MSAIPSLDFQTQVLELIKNDTPYLALYISNPGPTDTGTEVTGGSYVRQPITYGTITAGVMSNTGTITFPGMPASSVSHYAIFNDVTGGDMLVYGETLSAIISDDGDNAIFPIGDVVTSFLGS